MPSACLTKPSGQRGLKLGQALSGICLATLAGAHKVAAAGPSPVVEIRVQQKIGLRHLGRNPGLASQISLAHCV